MDCLTGEAIRRLKEAFVSKKIKPFDVAKMTSAKRRALFASIVGEEAAASLNLKFESKLILKNQKEGIIRWAKASIKTPKVKAEVIERVNKMEKILTPQEETLFYEDLVAQKLGFSVTMDEAAHIAELARDTTSKKESIDKKSKVGSKSRMEYGKSAYDYTTYVDGLKQSNIKKSVGQKIKDVKQNPVGETGKLLLETGAFMKSLVASFDNSAIGRQGWMTLVTNPKIWGKNAKRSFVDMYKTLKGEDVIGYVMADILSRPNSINGLYKKEGLATGTQEEAYPTSLPEKLPFVGKAFKASQDAYTAFLHRTRADLFDRLYEAAEATGQDTKGLGTVINSMTGRGSLGKRNEKVVNELNKVFFSPRNAKAIVDTLTAHAGNKNVSKFAKNEARKQLGMAVVFSAVLLGILRGVLGEDAVELDPRSSDFGKVRVNNTRFQVTAQYASYLTLVSRLLTGEVKSSRTGRMSDLSSGKYGSKNRWDLITDFIEGKIAPNVSFLKKALSEGDYNDMSEGAKVMLEFITNDNIDLDDAKIIGLLLDTITPLSVQNAFEVIEEEGFTPLSAATVAADVVGVGTNTY